MLLSTTDLKRHLPSLGATQRELCELPKIGLHSHRVYVRSPILTVSCHTALHLFITYKLIWCFHTLCMLNNCSRSYLPAQSRAASSRLYRAGIVTVYIIPNAFDLKTRSEMSILMATTYTSTSSSHSKLRSKLTRTKLPTPITAISCQGCYVVPKISTAPSSTLTPIHNKLLY